MFTERRRAAGAMLASHTLLRGSLIRAGAPVAKPSAPIPNPQLRLCFCCEKLFAPVVRKRQVQSRTGGADENQSAWPR